MFVIILLMVTILVVAAVCAKTAPVVPKPKAERQEPEVKIPAKVPEVKVPAQEPAQELEPEQEEKVAPSPQKCEWRTVLSNCFVPCGSDHSIDIAHGRVDRMYVVRNFYLASPTFGENEVYSLCEDELTGMSLCRNHQLALKAKRHNIEQEYEDVQRFIKEDLEQWEMESMDSEIDRTVTINKQVDEVKEFLDEIDEEKWAEVVQTMGKS